MPPEGFGRFEKVLRLGEGSGALVAVPIVKLAAVSVVDVATFQEWGLA